MIGIYKIENLINKKIYIGQSINIEKRWKEEKRRAFDITDKSYNYPLSRAFRKYGINNFSFEILEECQKEQLNQKEQYWIHYYNSFYKGYNQTIGGDQNNQAPKEKIIGIINDLKTTDMYHKEIAKKWNISIEMVQGINTGHYWFSSYKNYPLQKQYKSHANHIPKKWFCADCGKQISKGAERCRICADMANRRVKHPSKEELYTYLANNNGNFSKAGRDFGVTDNAVRKWCDAYGLPRLSKQWKEIIKRNTNDR